MVVDGLWNGSGSPSLTGKFFHKEHSLQQKSPCSPWGEQGQKDKFCGATLFAGKIRPLCPVPSHRLPRNAGNASEDTRDCSLSHCPRRPIVLNRFSLRSQLCGTLCGCAFSFTPASMVSNYVMPFIHEKCVFVKNYFASVVDNFLNIPGQRPGRCR